MQPARKSSVAALLFLMAACATTTTQSVPLPDPASPVASDLCRVYVLREGDLIGSLKDVRIYDGEREVGTLTQRGYLCWERRAIRGVGRVVFAGYTLDGGPVESVFDLPRQGGSTSYLVIGLRSSDRKPQIEAVDEKRGQELLAGREPAKVD